MRDKKGTTRKKTISSLGEFNLIKLFTKKLPNDPDVVLGIGDDCAIIKKNWHTYILYTTDMVIEDVHFKRRSAKPAQIGHKALARNISDIAAMGGVPTFAVVSLALPPSLPVTFAEGIYLGIKKTAERYGVAIVGGDTSKSAKIVISIALMGEVEKKWCVRRNGAKAGDELFVTGTLGGSLVKKHLQFSPRLDEAEFLVSKFPVTSMIDVSDGLLQDLGHIVAASNVGCILDERAIPVSADALKAARNNNKKAFEAALCDGEDFELLFTVPLQKKDELVKKWRDAFKVKLTHIGTMIEKRGIYMRERETEEIFELETQGYNHF